MIVKIEPVGFRQWLRKVNLAEHGDEYERKYHGLVLGDLPRVEEFWRAFVVPLTTRLCDYPNATGPSTSFRDGIGEDLQRISAANYSLFMHVAYAKRALSSWDEESSLDVVYLRLSSAFDVFESLCFVFWKLLCMCRGREAAGLERLDEAHMVSRASRFFAKDYERRFANFHTAGQTIRITVQNPERCVAECFEDVKAFRNYKAHSQNLRSMRNALVHEVRLGRIHVRGRILVPLTAVVNNYRTWSAVLKAALSEKVVRRDFCDPQIQAEKDFKTATAMLNELYATLVSEFETEFGSPERSKLRTLFLIEHGDPAQNEFKGTADAVFRYDGKNLGKSLVAEATAIELPVEFGWSGASGVACPSGDASFGGGEISGSRLRRQSL